jgi:hypothetical protein
VVETVENPELRELGQTYAKLIYIEKEAKNKFQALRPFEKESAACDAAMVKYNDIRKNINVYEKSE